MQRYIANHKTGFQIFYLTVFADFLKVSSYIVADTKRTIVHCFS